MTAGYGSRSVADTAARMPSIQVFATPEEASQAVAEFIAIKSDAAVKRSGRFTISLSGGNTTRSVYKLLAEPPLRDRIPWGHWHVFWGDERSVPLDHEDSNYHMASEALLNHVPIPAAQIHRFLTEQGTEKAAASLEADLQEAFPEPQPSFHLILLGVGDDGHTASIFPGTEALQEEDRLVISNRVPQLNTDRVTFSLPLINAAKSIAFVVTGESKALVLKQILEPGSGVATLPAAMVRPTSGTLDWFLTSDAASFLKSSQ
jgi:6-phosphogluconolactonase